MTCGTKRNWKSKHLAKIASQVAKPDGLVVVDIRTPTASVWVDRTRCIQAIVNLVSNAVRYSPEGARTTTSASPLSGVS